jgi:phenylacetate-coenzyme A ligase PaaK-like adenylate-forming protein
MLKLPLVREMADELASHDQWSRPQLLDYQRRRLRQTIAHAVAHSPYYRDAIGGSGDAPKRLQELPVLTKSQLMSEFDRIVTDPRLDRDLVERHIAEHGTAVPLLDRYRIYPTGGSTGIRTLVVFTRPTRLLGIANTLRWIEILGVTDETRVVSIGAATPLHISNQIGTELRHGRGAPALDVSMPIPRLVKALNAYRPEVLIAYPSILRELTLEQKAGRLAIQPRRCGSICETLAPEVRHLAMEVWQAPIIDSYATTETGQIGTDCGFASGIHVLEELMKVEVVDENRQPVPDGTPGDRLLVTTFFNSVMPLIRYEITDQVAFAKEPCLCGRPHARLMAIQGRAEEMLELPAKAGGTMRVAAVRFRDPLLLNVAVRQYQYSTAPGKLQLRVVLAPDTRDPEAVLESLSQAIGSQMAQVGAEAAALAITQVERIDRTAHAGKERLVARAP